MKTKSENVIKYIKKYNCQIIKKWRYGIPQFRILKEGNEKSYPHINEEIFCNILHQLEKVSDYEIPEGGIFNLKTFKLKLTIEIELENIIDPTDKDQQLWLEDFILVDDGTLKLHSEEIGDTLGVVKKVTNIQYLNIII